jgi:tetratricopeptide (TPR) repeat protein
MAEASFKRAIDLNPGYATAHHWYADYLTKRERFDEAAVHIQTSLALDPLSVSVNGAYGAILLFARRYDEAIDRLQTTVRMNPGFAHVHMVLSQAFGSQQRYDLAVEEAQRAVSLGAGNVEYQAHLGCTLAMAGKRAEAASIARDLAARYQRGDEAQPVAVAIVYAVLGDNDRVFEWLDRAWQIRDPWLGYLRVDPRFDNVRADPRFRTLLQQVGLAR